MTLQLLISKLSEAGGGSDELDGLIAQALGLMPLSARWEHRDSYGMLASDPIWVSGGYGDYKFHDPEPYTTSLDAALSLVEQKLPGWEWLVRSSPSYACVWQAKGVGDLSAEATLARPATPTLALLVALLRALEASPPSPQGPR